MGIFQAVATVALWPRCAHRLVVAPLVLVLRKGARGGGGGCIHPIKGHWDWITPLGSALVQVTHTVPTRRSALYVPLGIALPQGGIQYPLSSSFLRLFLLGVGLTVPGQVPATIKPRKQYRPKGRHCFRRFFATGSLGTQEGDVGGVGYIAEVWGLGPMAEVN